ncbi:MAG: hypothetical protein OEV69_02765 [Gammaproteobacteria bacterium]|nr:hypothetical protein [Gammaproteobacteria bacterium]
MSQYVEILTSQSPVASFRWFLAADVRKVTPSAGGHEKSVIANDTRPSRAPPPGDRLV